MRSLTGLQLREPLKFVRLNELGIIAGRSIPTCFTRWRHDGAHIDVASLKSSNAKELGLIPEVVAKMKLVTDIQALRRVDGDGLKKTVQSNPIDLNLLFDASALTFLCHVEARIASR